jgi:YidC/Oxa1 family membrane protein insertase
LDTSRFLIAFILLIALTALYPEMVQWLYPRHNPAGNQTESVKGGAKPIGAKPTHAIEATPAGSPVQSAASPVPPPAGTMEATPAVPNAAGVLPVPLSGAGGGPERTVVIDTDLYEAVLTTRGARLKSFRLKHYGQTAAPDSPWYEMVDGGERLPLGLVVASDGEVADDRALDYTTDAPQRLDVMPGKPVTVTFTARTRDGLAIEKRLTFRDSSYVFDIGAQVTGTGATAVKRIGFTMSQPLAAHQGYYDIPEVQGDVNGKAITESEKSLKKGVASLGGSITYAGFGDRYFLSAFLPKTAAPGTLEMDFADDEADAMIMFGGVSRLDSAVYMGPKELNILEAVNPQLSKAIDFGWSGIIALPFLRALKLFHYVAPNYGVDIILLTVVLRILTLPMSIKSQRSMMRLQRLQPQVERIREKFKGDTERLNREMVDLYKRNHVNPLGGCLPTAIQLPIFLGLYEALLNAVELRHAPFMAWIKDLSAPDCFPIPSIPKLPFFDCHGIPVLVLLMGMSTFLQQWMSPSSPDPNQQRMMLLMPVVFTLLFINFPAGLSLYYFSSNLLGIIQQFSLNREFKQFTPVAST